jgi:hypothetical protein
VAYGDRMRQSQPEGGERDERRRSCNCRECVADTHGSGQRSDAGCAEQRRNGIAFGDGALADANEQRSQGRSESEPCGSDECVARASGTERRDDGDNGIAQSGMGGAIDGIPGWVDRWPAPPGQAQHEWEAPRTAEGIQARTRRLKALGNAVVPAQGREAVRRLLVPLLRGEP